MQAARTTLRSSALLLLATLGIGAQPEHRRPQVPKGGTVAVQDEASDKLSWDDLLRRDERVGFTARTADLARAVLEREVHSPAEYKAALMAAAESNAVHLRHHLEAAATVEDIGIRRAALVALGEYRSRVGQSEPTLHAGLEDPRAAGCALFALFRVDVATAARIARGLKGTDKPGTYFAERVEFWDGVAPGPDCTPARIRLELRWDAARRFGTVDGRAWSRILIEELSRDQVFLEHFVFMQAAQLGGPVVRDHLATLLVEEPSRVVVQACVRSMHAELDQILGSGAWAPEDEGLWFTLVNEAIRTGAARDMPHAMRLAGSREDLQPLVLPFLAKHDEEILEKVLLDMESPKTNRRRMTVRGVGAAALVPAVRKLYAMEEDSNPAVRAEAWVVRCRLGDGEAFAHVREMLTRSLGSEPDPEVLRERQLVQQALMFHSAGRLVQKLMLDLVDRMPLDDERLPYFLAALRIEGHAVDAGLVIQTIARRDVLEGQDEILIRAIGHVPGSVALAHLTERFPNGGSTIIDLELAHALAGVSSPEIQTLLSAAVFGENWHFGVLAAAVVEEHYGRNALMLWALQPPEGTGPGALRRLGFAIGEIGQLDALEELTRRLGHGGADRPVLQGALLGALSGRSH
tara:strand:- start:8890 stop:10791 length:1902 start_codon:yes stop_codon:yes gene_type:complete